MTIPNFWARIRKLVLPEPLHGSWGSEETAPLPAEANVSGWASSENIRGKTQFTVTYVNKL